MSLLAAAALWVKGYRTGAQWVALGMICIVTAWGVLMLAPVFGINPAVGLVSMSLALVGNAVACEGAARAGKPPIVPPGLIYGTGLVVGFFVPCFGFLIPLPESVSWLSGTLAVFWTLLAASWLFAAGGAMAAIQAIRLPRVGGYDDLD